MKILVTGSAGFIGYHVSKYLLRNDYEVVGLDNFNDYYDVSLKEDRNKQLQRFKHYTCYRIDLCDSRAVTELFTQEKPDKICALAAQAGVRYSLDHPHTYAQSNIVGFLNLLEACRHFEVSRCVYASSSSVYGGNTKLPFAECDPVDTPVSLYAASKKANELMAHCYTHLYGFQTVGLRFFTVYGPWGRPDMAMWLFTKAILAGRPIKVFNHGDMQRDFTYVDDIVKGVVASLEKEELDAYEVFNLGNHRSENLLDLIGIVEKELGVEAQKELLPMQMGDVKATYADVEKARKKLDFEPSTSIREGVPQFIAWYKKYHKVT
ncbi:MAG: NAD-dependent epimerase/dehydratase family protein [Chitinivibrionales bacterium]|nr:NAD-dependent epimerase/dehydratase family protein [Chitinivibrionales bacterium]